MNLTTPVVKYVCHTLDDFTPPPRPSVLPRPDSSPQRWFPLSPPANKTEDSAFGGGAESNSSGGGGSDGRRWATAMEQRRATDFAHYNPIIQVRCFFVLYHGAKQRLLKNALRCSHLMAVFSCYDTVFCCFCDNFFFP